MAEHGLALATTCKNCINKNACEKSDGDVYFGICKEFQKDTNKRTYIDLEKANVMIFEYMLEQTVSKYPSSEIARGVRLGIGNVMLELAKIPAADVVEVVHGEWEIKSELYRMMEDDFDEQLYVECPYCKRRFYVPSAFDDEEIFEYARENYPYCHCGAKMDGERKEQG